MAAPMQIFQENCRRCILKKTRCLAARQFSTTRFLNKGLVVGVYQGKEKTDAPIPNKTFEYFNTKSGGKLADTFKLASKDLKTGGCRTLYGVVPGYDSVAVCCIGKQGTGYSEPEQLEEGLENVRTAVAGGVRALRAAGETQVDVDPCGNPEAAAEGGHLCLFEYDELKAEDKRKKAVTLNSVTDQIPDSIAEQWTRGRCKAEGQNFARRLMEAPANQMTPRIFTETVAQKFANRPNVNVIIRDKDWIEKENMRSFLAVSQGSAEPPYFLEVVYKHPDCKLENPIALVGKGVTFDTGGISIKPAGNMDAMRADMGGAACVIGSLLAVDKMNLNTYVHAFIPLCENMPGGRAIKPGDVVTARNGKTVQIDNTDAEGRLILADALNYSETVKPQLILDMATLTGAIDVALGSAATGVFASSTSTWNLIEKAGGRTGDRMWRMPLFKHYSKQVTESALADVNNIGKYSRSGGSCTAAAFLKEFVTHKDWLHLDIAGVMSNKDEVPYLGKGMAGRPTRTIVEFIEMRSKPQE